MPSAASKVRAWDSKNQTRSILEDLRWENEWRLSDAFKELAIKEKLRWRKHIVKNDKVGRLLRYEAYMSTPPWTQRQVDALKDFRGFWYKFGKALHIVEEGVHRVVPMNTAEVSREDLPSALQDTLGQRRRGDGNVIAIAFPSVDEDPNKYVPHLAPRACRKGLNTLRDKVNKAALPFKKAMKKLDRRFNTARVYQTTLDTNDKKSTRTRPAPRSSYRSWDDWRQREGNTYAADEGKEWFQADDAYDKALIYLYQEQEVVTLASRIGSCVHEKLMASMLVDGADVYAPLLPNNEIPLELKDLVEETTGAGHVLGYSDHNIPRTKVFYTKVVKNMVKFFQGAKAVAVEYPVHHPNLCLRTGSKLAMLETRLDAVLERGEKYIVVEYKTINGSKWAESSPIQRIEKELWPEALAQTLIGAHLFSLNTTLTVEWLCVVFIERKRDVQHVFKVRYTPSRALEAKTLCEALFPENRVFVNNVGVSFRMVPRLDIRPSALTLQTIKKLMNVKIPSLLGKSTDLDWIWKRDEDGRVEAPPELEYLVGHPVKYRNKTHLIVRIEDRSLVLVRKRRPTEEYVVDLGDVTWSKSFVKQKLKKLRMYALTNFAVEDKFSRDISEEDLDALLRERSALYEVALLLDENLFHPDKRLDMYQVSRRLHYDQKDDIFSLDGEPLKYHLNTTNGAFVNVMGIAPSRNVADLDIKPTDRPSNVPQEIFRARSKVSKEILRRLKGLINPVLSGDIQRDFDKDKTYNGWVAKTERTLAFPDKNSPEWIRYKTLMNKSWETVSRKTSVYPSGWYSVTPYRAEWRNGKMQVQALLPTASVEDDARLVPTGISFEEFVEMFLRKDNAALRKYLEGSRDPWYYKKYLEQSTDDEVDFGPSESLVLVRDGCVPLSACGDSDDQIEAPLVSTRLGVPEERKKLHMAVLEASEVVPLRIPSETQAMQSTEHFEAACQAFEKTPEKCAYEVGVGQALDVRAYRALNRRINRRIADKYNGSDFIVHHSSRSMWKEEPLRDALAMVEPTKVDLVEALKNWGASAERPSRFEGFDY